jgi:hypothetical protein
MYLPENWGKGVFWAGETRPEHPTHLTFRIGYKRFWTLQFCQVTARHKPGMGDDLSGKIG